jgi:diguanylate cyclase (GGDEF)-like protein
MSSSSDRDWPISALEMERDGSVRRLIEARSPLDVCFAIETWAESLPDCESAQLQWGNTNKLVMAKDEGAAAEDAFIQAMPADGALCLDDTGRVVAWSLLPAERVVLQLRFTVAQSPSCLQEQMALYLTVASHHLSRALELADLRDSHKQLERSENLQRALFAISDLASSDREMPDLLRGIQDIVNTLMYAENFVIVRYDPNQGTMRFLYYVDVVDKQGPAIGQDELIEKRACSLTWYLLTGGKPLMGNMQQLREQVPGPLMPQGPDAVDWLGVPMLRDGQVHGALVVQSYREGIVYSDEDRVVLEFVANHILIALERRKSKDELEQRVRQRTRELAEANRGLQQKVQERQRAERLQAALFKLAQLATADIDEREFYQQVHAVVGELLNAQNFFIALLSDDRLRLDFPYYKDTEFSSMPSRPLGSGLSEYVLRRAHPLLATSADLEALSRSGEVEPNHLGKPALCWLGVPLLVDEEVMGLVVVQNSDQDDVYGLPDQELLSFAALQIANSIYRRRTTASLYQTNEQLEQRVEERTRELSQQIRQREQAQLQLKHQVMHDPLTGLPNRGFMRDRLDRVLALLQRKPERRCALLYIDVDRFKVVNDSLGHLAGDAFLQEIARRLQQCVRDPDVVARLSGDEFAILLEDIESPSSAVNVAQRVLQTIGQVLVVAGKELQPSASVGIAIGDTRYRSADEVLHDADIALYRAKELGRRRFELFDETLAKNLVDVLTLEGELRHALLHREFEPYFQPVQRFDDDKVVGYELLLRWNHPSRGLLVPHDFLKIAHDSGQIEAIDWLIFEMGCTQFLRLPDQTLFLTINVSALHLAHDDFDQTLLQLLRHAGLAASRLIVEVTEGALLEDPERVRDLLERLRQAGVGAALDDFGTGYSSLSYLHSLPLRLLKIDRAFVQALDCAHKSNSNTVVEAILALARALDIHVIAEGIELDEQKTILNSMGCELGQGYLLGRPAPISHWTTSAPGQV